MNEHINPYHPTALDFWMHTGEILHHMRHGGVLCTVVDRTGAQNLLTLGWGLIGPFYHGHPIFAIAVTPLRYSWRFLEAVPEFVIAVAADATKAADAIKPDNALKEAVSFCGTHSGRDMDKFAAAELTPIPSVHVKAPSILECPINIECRIYNSVAPPHKLLTPEHRQSPLDEQHTIYFAEVLGTYRWTM